MAKLPNGVTLDRKDAPEVYSMCQYCTHVNNLDPEQRRCAAFRNKPIPLIIWNGQDQHLRLYPGDHGLRFELAT